MPELAANLLGQTAKQSSEQFGLPVTVHRSVAGEGKDKPAELPAYPYPIFVAYASQPVDVIHGITHSMIVNYDAYKAGAPGADGLELKRQNLAWAVPYHDGAVKAIKEAGAWTPEAQAHNDALVKRQNTLIAAWNEFTKGATPDDKDAFYKAWMAKRKDALTKAGMDPVFD